MTDAERRAALEAIAEEIRDCTRCRLHENRSRSVPGEGNASTEVVFVGEGPGFNEDRQGRPFVGRAGDLLVRLLARIGWRRDDVFITNIVKCRPPENRDPEPDEIAACAPFLRRQLEVLDPALVVTLGRHSLGRFMPGARISQAHGTVRPVDPATGASNALAFAMYHPAAALRAPDIERQSYGDIEAVPGALLASRERRAVAPLPPVNVAAGRAAELVPERPSTPGPVTSPAETRDRASLPSPAAPGTAALPGIAALPGTAGLPATAGPPRNPGLSDALRVSDLAALPDPPPGAPAMAAAPHSTDDPAAEQQMTLF
ncbi:MAG TPA: uracil-DNA glycosylase family protein [Candidatus Limnocylindrales bacterium]